MIVSDSTIEAEVLGHLTIKLGKSSAKVVRTLRLMENPGKTSETGANLGGAAP